MLDSRSWLMCVANVAKVSGEPVFRYSTANSSGLRSALPVTSDACLTDRTAASGRMTDGLQERPLWKAPAADCMMMPILPTTSGCSCVENLPACPGMGRLG